MGGGMRGGGGGMAGGMRGGGGMPGVGGPRAEPCGTLPPLGTANRRRRRGRRTLSVLGQQSDRFYPGLYLDLRGYRVHDSGYARHAHSRVGVSWPRSGSARKGSAASAEGRAPFSFFDLPQFWECLVHWLVSPMTYSGESVETQMNADERRRALNEITEAVIGCAFRVSDVLGCGFL